MNLEFTKNRLVNSKNRIDRFIDENVVDWTEQEILLPTRHKILEFGLSQNASNAVTIVKKGYQKVTMKWDYKGHFGEPLYLWLEKGFGKGGYDIFAMGKENGGADHLHWVDSSGKKVFRKKVRHPGFDGYHILENSWSEHRDQLIMRAKMEIKNFMEVNRL